MYQAKLAFHEGYMGVLSVKFKLALISMINNLSYLFYAYFSFCGNIARCYDRTVLYFYQIISFNKLLNS